MPRIPTYGEHLRWPQKRWCHWYSLEHPQRNGHTLISNNPHLNLCILQLSFHQYQTFAVTNISTKMEQQQSINVVEDIMDMASRRKACWRESDCKSCLKSKHNCGWCPSVCEHLLYNQIYLEHLDPGLLNFQPSSPTDLLSIVLNLHPRLRNPAFPNLASCLSFSFWTLRTPYRNAGM